jgi:hypothetical protein
MSIIYLYSSVMAVEKMKHYIAIIILLLSGCATTGSLHPGAGTKIVVEGKSYDKVWDTSVAAVSNQLTVVESNKDTGVIKAEGKWDGRRFSRELVGVFINPPADSDEYTVEVVSLHGHPDWSTGDGIADELKRALGLGPESYGTIGLVSARFDPAIEFNYVTEGKGHGALKAAGKGAKIGAVPGVVLMGGGVSCSPLLFCVVVFVGGAGVAIAGAAVGTVVGGVTGAVKADSAETVQEQQAQATAVLAGLKLQEAMRVRVEQYANKKGGPMFVTLSDAGPATPDEKVSYQSLLTQKIDTVLEITVTRLGMQTGDKYKSDINPSLAVFIKARAHLVRTKTNAVLEDKTYDFESDTRIFSEWTADNGRLIAESLTRGYQQIAEQVYHSFF